MSERLRQFDHRSQRGFVGCKGPNAYGHRHPHDRWRRSGFDIGAPIFELWQYRINVCLMISNVVRGANPFPASVVAAASSTVPLCLLTAAMYEPHLMTAYAS